MKMTKKILSFLAAVAVSVAVFGTSDVQAEEMKNIATNTVVTDSLESGDDTNYYVFTVDKSGYIEVEFTKVDLASNVNGGWWIWLCDMNGASHRYWQGYKTSFVSPKMNYKAGTKLYVKIAAACDWDAPVGVAYSLKIKTTADSSWEQEDNDSSSAATVIGPNQEKTGSLIYSLVKDDIDYYAYTVDRKGYFEVEFSKKNPTDEAAHGWSIVLYNQSGQEIDRYNGCKTAMTTQKYNFKPGTKVYVAVHPGWIYEIPGDIQYTIKINQAAKTNWEVETTKYEGEASWNARIKSVANLSAKKIYGSLWRQGDDDVYKLSAKKNGTITVKFNPQNVESALGRGYVITVHSKNGKQVAEYTGLTYAKNIKFNVKKGNYYVVVKGNNYEDPVGNVYTISATSKTFTVPSMKSKKITYKSSSDILKWKKVKKVDGYEIQLCKNKKFKKKATTVFTSEKTSYELPWNLDDGTYYVRIRAYKDTVTGDKVYGKFTKVKKIRIK